MINRKMTVSRLVVLAVLTAIAVVGRYAFSMLPNVKPMAAITIISGASLGAGSGLIVGAFSMLASNMIFGQGPWTPWQMLSMGLIGFFAGCLFGRGRIWKHGKGRRIFSLCLYGFFSVLILYGGIMNPASLIMISHRLTPENLKAIYLSGIPMDLVHAASTVFFLLLGAEPFLKKLERVKRKFPVETKFPLEMESPKPEEKGN